MFTYSVLKVSSMWKNSWHFQSGEEKDLVGPSLIIQIQKLREGSFEALPGTLASFMYH